MKEPSLKSEFYYLEAKLLRENKKHIVNTYTFEWPSFKGKTTFNIQGRSQDFSVGTHSFPSNFFTPPPPPKKKIKVIFDSRVFYFKSRAQES